MGKRIITDEQIIRVETNDGRTVDFPLDGDRYTGGRYQANQYTRDALEQGLEPETYVGTITTDIAKVDNV